MRRPTLAFAAPVALALTLASCGRGNADRQEFAAANCPTAMTVQDAQQLIRFKPGVGRDPRDIMFEAQLVAAGTTCKLSRDRMEIDVIMRIAVNAGPSVSTGVTQVPFFVRLLGPTGAVIMGRDELAGYKLSQSSPRGLSQEEMSVELPYSEVSQVQGFKIAVGLKPTPEELEYNRRAAGRP